MDGVELCKYKVDANIPEQPKLASNKLLTEKISKQIGECVMNTKQKMFIGFLDKLGKTSGQTSLMEAVKEGYKACFESFDDADNLDEDDEYTKSLWKQEHPEEEYCEGRVHPDAPDADKQFVFEHKDAYQDICDDNGDYQYPGTPTLYKETETTEYANGLATRHNMTMDDAKRLISIYVASYPYYRFMMANEYQRGYSNRIPKYEYYNIFD